MFYRKISSENRQWKKFFLGLSGGVDSSTLGCLISQKFGKERIDSFIITEDWLDKNATDFAIILGQAITFVNNMHITTHQSIISANVPETAVELGNFGTYQGEISPFAHFFKHEIYCIARELKVPQEAIDRVPGSEILDTMTDEELIGIPYDKLEKYLLNVKINDDGCKAFSLEYLTQDREGLRILSGITEK